MKFNFLNLKAFGHFTNQEIHFENTKGFHMIYGSNEAGKSTTLRSINAFLYGIPVRTTDSFLHDNRKLEIEGELENILGETLHMIRRKGNKNTLLDVERNPIDEAILEKFLNSRTQEQFETMFGIDHVLLREGGQSLLESGGSLGESIFSAASGISMLRKVFNDLDNEVNDLFKKQRQKDKITVLLNEQNNINKEIAELQLKIRDWKELETNYKGLEDKVNQLNTNIDQLNQKQQKLKRIKRTSSLVAQLHNYTSDLEELGILPNLIENSKELREQAQGQLQKQIQTKKQAKEDLEKLEDRLQEIIIPEGLMDQSSIINSLYQEVKSYQESEINLPKLISEREQKEKSVLNLMADIRPKMANLQNIESYRLSAEQKETIIELCDKKPNIEKDLENAKNSLTDLENELDSNKNELTLLTEYPPVDLLEEVINHVNQEGRLEEQIEAAQKNKQQSERVIQEAIMGLTLWNGTYEEFIKLNVSTLNETIKRYEETWNDLTQQQNQVEKDLLNEQESIRRNQKSIEELENLTEIPTKEDLKYARAHRDEGWSYIRTKLSNGVQDEKVKDYTNGQELEFVYEKDVQKSDELSNVMILESEKAGRKNKLLDDIKSSEEMIEIFKKLKETTLKALQEWEDDWKELWKPVNIEPLSPPEMKEWLGNYNEIKDLVRDLDQKEQALKELEEKKRKYINKLEDILSKYTKVDKYDSLSTLLDFAYQIRKDVTVQNNKRKNLMDKIDGNETKIKQITEGMSKHSERLQRWKNDWEVVIEGTGISKMTTPTVAKKLVGKYEACIAEYNNLEQTKASIIQLTEQVEVFKKRVDDVCAAISIETSDSRYEVKVDVLYRELQEAIGNEHTIKEITPQIVALKEIIRDSDKEIEQAKMVMEDLLKQAQCQTIEVLISIEDKCSSQQKIKKKQAEKKDELLSHGEGLSLDQIISEVSESKIDRIDSELDEMGRLINEYEKERSEKYIEFGASKNEYDEKIKGSSTQTIEKEQEKQSLFSQINEYVEQYIQLKLAAILLKRGIETYREQNQDPILKRAGQIFNQLTLESFTDLIVDYDEKDQPVLMGLRSSNEKVGMDGMSDGTKDQLYLSLRLASIEQYTTKNEPIPFIVDDILVHFDDERSMATLKVLLELSTKTQVIFFTHHSRHIELIEEVATDGSNAYQLIDLNQKTAIVQ